jgi:hypothetical protein
MLELDRLLQALALVALLLYLVPAAFGSGISARGRRWLQRGAILALGTALAVAVGATLLWLGR